MRAETAVPEQQQHPRVPDNESAVEAVWETVAPAPAVEATQAAVAQVPPAFHFAIHHSCSTDRRIYVYSGPALSASPASPMALKLPPSSGSETRHESEQIERKELKRKYKKVMGSKGKDLPCRKCQLL